MLLNGLPRKLAPVNGRPLGAAKKEKKKNQGLALVDKMVVQLEKIPELPGEHLLHPVPSAPTSDHLVPNPGKWGNQKASKVSTCPQMTPVGQAAASK